MMRVDRVETYVCPANATVAEALAKIDRASPYLFQIVLSSEGKVLGTITDGDIRRAMLRGVTIDSAVEACMRHTPIVGRLGEDVTNRVLLKRAWFLPVVNDLGQLDHILIERRFEQPLNRALVMAGGFGRRLGNLTRETPKPLLTIGARPILDRVLELIEAAGVTRIYIAVHYRAEQIRTFVARRRNVAEIVFIDEDEPLGTAGALARLSNHLDEPILVANGDVLTQVDFAAMHEFHTRHAYDGTVAVSRYEMQVPYGVIRQTAEGSFAGIDEKPHVTHFVAAGLYYLSPEFIALTPRNRPVDMPELLTAAAGAGLRIGLFPVHEYWKDVGQPSDFAAAQTDHNGT